MRMLKDTPRRAVENGEVAQYGLFKEPFRELNLLEAAVPGVPRALRKFRLKEWQHYAVITPEHFVAFVVNTAHYMAISFCYVVERATGRLLAEHHAEALPGAAAVPRELWHGDCRFARRGYEIAVENRLESGFHRAKIAVAAARGVPAIRADFTFQQDLQAVQPLVTILRVSENRPLYTHKTVCPASGELRVGDLRIELDAARDLVLVDIQKTFYPVVTEWRWATCAGYDAEGRLIALNLVRNMLPDQETNNENVLWVDGRLSAWGAANFTFDVERVTEPWRIETSDGRCSLEMRPVAERAGRINLGVLLSDYHAPVGTFSGTVTDDQGATYEIRDFFGVAEHHRARF